MANKTPAWLRWLLTILTCLGIAAALIFYKFSQTNAGSANFAAQPEYSETVEVAQATLVLHKPVIQALGVVLATRQITLRNELAGYIRKINFSSAQSVEASAVILQLDISEQEANLAAARTRLKLAGLTLDRSANLRKTDAVSQGEVDRLKAELDVIEAEISGIQSVIDRRTIRAPFSGTIGLHQLEAGQYLPANTEITTLVVNNNERWVDFSVPQMYGELSVGSMVSVEIIHDAGLTPYPLLEATVIAADSVISPEARSRKYRALISNASSELLPNMSVSVMVPVGEERELLSVPSTAVQSDGAGEFVYLLDQVSAEPAYRARHQPVTVYHNQGDVSYLDGINPEDLIAAAGAFKLAPGLLVKVGTRPNVAVNQGESR